VPDTSFVETLDLANDERLTALRPGQNHAEEPGLRRGTRQPAAEAIGPNLRAAVNGGALVSSSPGWTNAR
jgi:hypothetical protein